MAVDWEEASTPVLDLARRIIADYHPKLADARILFIMRSEAPVTNGKVTYGKAKKLSAELQVHIDADFIIWFAKDEWTQFSAKQREALMDHELSHCFWDGLTASMRAHDVEEFTHIIKRHGFWWPGSKSFETAVNQAVQQPLPLPPTEPPRQGSVGTIDFGRIAKEVGEQMKADGFDVEVSQVPGTVKEG